jgi:hypothetical protein
MRPISLSDSQMFQLKTTASAVSQPIRAEFLRRVADLVRGRDYAGSDGAFFRLCQAVAREVAGQQPPGATDACPTCSD